MRLRAAVLTAVLALTASAAVATPPPSIPVTWVREGFAEARALAAVDVDADGVDEIVYGGRGVALLDVAGQGPSRPVWSSRPIPEDAANPLDGGDNAWTTGVAATEATGDDVPDLLVTTSDTDAYLLDGRTGDAVWHNPRTGPLFSYGFAVIDGDADGIDDLFPTGGKTAISGADGEPLWTAEIGANATDAVTAELDGEPGRDVLIAHGPALTNPTLYAYSGDGELLWSFPGLTVIHSLAAADIDADGIDEAIVGQHNGLVLAVGSSGLRWASPVGTHPTRAVATGDTDGDGRAEVYAVADVAQNRFDAVALGPEGAVRWRHPLPDGAAVLTPTAGQLLVGTGTDDRSPGIVVSLSTTLTDVVRERWRVPTEGAVRAIVTATEGDRTVVAIGGDEAVLRTVDADTGREVRRWYSGDFLRAAAAGDLDGDGATEFVTGDDRGHVQVMGPGGAVRWAATPSPGRSSILGVGVLRGGPAAVTAVAKRYSPSDQSSTVAAWDAAGMAIWSTHVPGSAEELAVVDVDVDGTDDVLVAEAPSLHPQGDGCFVSAYDGTTGERLWRTRTAPSCLVPHIAVSSPGGPIGYGEQALFSVPHVAVLEPDGRTRFNLEVSEATAWVAIDGDALVTGGFASGARGHVTARSLEDGAIRWQTHIEPLRDPVHDQVHAAGASRYGTLLAEPDGPADVLTTSDDGSVKRLDGTTGAVEWSTEIEPRDQPYNWRRVSGPIALMDRPDAAPLVVTGQFVIGQPMRANGFVLDTSGQLLGGVPLLREARALAVGEGSSGRPATAFAAGLSLTVVAP